MVRPFVTSPLVILCGRPGSIVGHGPADHLECYAERRLEDRSAGARVAAHDTRLLVIKRVDLVALCEQDYELGYLLMRNIAADMAFKMRSADLAVREQLLWVSGGSDSRYR